MKARRWLIVLLVLGVLVGLNGSIAIFQMNGWWFQAVGYPENFRRQWQSQFILALCGGGITALWLGFNLWWGKRSQPQLDPLRQPLALTGTPLRSPLLRTANLPSLLLLWLTGGLLLWGSLFWVFAPPRTPETFLWCAILLAITLLAATLQLSPLLKFLAIGLSGGWGYVWANRWQQVLPAWVATSFNQREAVFDRDLSFYVFQLPFWEAIDRYTLSLSLTTLGLVLLMYVTPHLSQGRWEGWNRPQKRHLALVLGLIALALAQHFYLLQYQLLYSQRGVVYGAGYSDLWVYLPLDRLVCWSCLGLSGYALGAAIELWGLGRPPRWLLLGLGILIPAYFLLPIAVQRSIVQPNELALEKPYLQRSISATRQAFQLDQIEVRTFDPSGTLTAADLVKNAATLKNIRLWDARPLLQSNRQLQQLRPYYTFANVDIDRYPLDNQSQQVMLSPRELDSKTLVGKAGTWENRHLVYTHGYGFTVSPVNRAAPGGLPDYLVEGIETRSSQPEFRVPSPRIYYGEVTDNYVFAPSKSRELDYASGDKIFYNTYDGGGGVPLYTGWQRWIGASYLRDWQALLTNNFQSNTQLLLHRSIRDRVQKLAPWLSFDSDPYLVAAQPGATGQNRLYWVLDAYTSSDHYPYSDPGSATYNYLRNSVKITVDAYDGATQFYVNEPQDPILQTWQKILPAMWQPISKMPEDLRQHRRYPSDLFRIQSDRLLTYHMEDPQTFYNREDLWQIPQEIYGGKAQAVEPYYLITKLPTVEGAEFVLLSPFTPSQRTNLIAWLAARSDGEHYGRLLLYQFPKQQLVYGTEQIESLINQDPAISQQISLWNRQGVSAVQGNLLVIPIEQSLLYVEPLYLEAKQNALPTLGRTIVVYRDRIAMAETLAQALEKIFPVTPTRS
jgi:uncharacterized protein